MKEKLTVIMLTHKGFKEWVKNNYGDTVGYGLWNHSLKSDLILSIIQKWLRDVFNIHVNPIPNFKTKIGEYHLGIVFINDEGKIDTILIKDNTDDKFSKLSYFDTHEEALEKGLFEALKLIK